MADLIVTVPDTTRILPADVIVPAARIPDLPEGGGGATTLDALTDVATAGQAAGKALISDGTNWTPSSAAVVLTTDSRLSDARTPTPHASTHASAGSDPIAAADIGAAAASHSHTPSDVTGTALVATLVDAKGDLIVATAADTVARLAVGTDGQVLTADSAQTAGVKWAAAAGGSVANWIPNYWTIPGYGIAGQADDDTNSANVIRLTPFTVSVAGYATGLRVRVRTGAGAGAVARLGIFSASDLTLSLVVDAGELSIETSGIKAVTISTLLSAGDYMAGFLPSVNVNMTTYHVGGLRWGGYVGSDFDEFPHKWTVAHTYGPLPSSATAVIGKGSWTWASRAVQVRMGAVA